MKTQVSLGGSAPPIDSLDSSVDVWDSVLLRVLSATLVATHELEPLLVSLFILGECMVMRAFAGGWSPITPAKVPEAVPGSEAGAEDCSVSGAGTCNALVALHVEVEVTPQPVSEAKLLSTVEGIALPYKTKVMLSAEAES